MKKKLLITLGCSFTEGVGAYDLNMGYTEKDFSFELYKNSEQRFHEYGWPAFLQKKLKYDKLINLGIGGASNSYAAKRFFELFHNNNLSDEYDVLVIWMLTFPERIAFYKHSALRSLCPGEHLSYADKVFYRSYVKNMGNYEVDSTLETIFYLKTIETACKAYNFNFLYTTPMPNPKQNKIKNYYVSENLIDSYLKKSIKYEEHLLNNPRYPINHRKYMEFLTLLPDLLNPYYTSPVCKHPNEIGYEYIADGMFAIISEFFSQYINNKYEPNEYENVYEGNSKFWKPMNPKF